MLDDATELVARLMAERDEARAEVERLRAELALGAARKERDRTIDCGQDPALGCAEAPGCLRCFGIMNGELVAERDAAIAERDALRKAVEALRDECLEQAALDAKGRAYTSACVREWCAARIDQVLRGVL